MIFPKHPIYNPPPKTKAVLNPKTGKYETVEVKTVSQEDLERARKECKDRIAGNEQFHDDPFKTPPPPKEDPDYPDAYDMYQGCFMGAPTGMSLLIAAARARDERLRAALMQAQMDSLHRMVDEICGIYVSGK